MVHNLFMPTLQVTFTKPYTSQIPFRHSSNWWNTVIRPLLDDQPKFAKPISLGWLQHAGDQIKSFVIVDIFWCYRRIHCIHLRSENVFLSSQVVEISTEVRACTPPLDPYVSGYFNNLWWENHPSTSEVSINKSFHRIRMYLHWNKWCLKSLDFYYFWSQHVKG